VPLPRGNDARLVLTIVAVVHLTDLRVFAEIITVLRSSFLKFDNSRTSFSVRTRGGALSLTLRVSHGVVAASETAHGKSRLCLIKNEQRMNTRGTRGLAGKRERERERDTQWLRCRSNRANAPGSALYSGRGISTCSAATGSVDSTS